MTRTPALLALLLIGCTGTPADGVTDPGHDIDTPADVDTDADTDADDLADVTFTNAPVTYAERVGDEIVTSSVETENIGFNVCDGDEDILSANTVYTEPLKLDKYTAQADHYDEYGVHWISDPVNVNGVEVELVTCVDLTGTWDCYMVGYESNVDDETIEMTSCTATTTMDDDVLMDGNHFTSDDYDGFVSEDGATLDLNVYANSGDLFGNFICDKQ